MLLLSACLLGFLLVLGVCSCFVFVYGVVFLVLWGDTDLVCTVLCRIRLGDLMVLCAWILFWVRCQLT